MLRYLIAAFAAVAAMVAGAIPASAQTPDEQRGIDWALERGRLLYALDRAAWVATDDLRRRVPDLAAAGVQGYVVDRDDRGLIPIFFGREGDRFVAIYRARIGPRGVIEPQVFAPGARPELTPAQQRLARTLIALRGLRRGRCSRSAFNVALVPPASADVPIDAYIMTPQEQTDRLPFGGHYRITLAPDGRELAARDFARSCIALPVPPAAERARGAILAVSHGLDPIPTEIHVFSALAAQQPIGVIVERPARVWEVTGERMRVLQEGGVAPPKP